MLPLSSVDHQCVHALSLSLGKTFILTNFIQTSCAASHHFKASVQYGVIWEEAQMPLEAHSNKYKPVDSTKRHYFMSCQDEWGAPVFWEEDSDGTGQVHSSPTRKAGADAPGRRVRIATGPTVAGLRLVSGDLDRGGSYTAAMCGHRYPFHLGIFTRLLRC